MNPAPVSTAQEREALLTAKALADRLNVPVSWIYDNVGQLPAFRIGKSLRFRASEIDEWLESRREGARYDVR